MATLVTMVTDFGTRDGYAGEMKGVVLSRAPDARLVDVTHELDQGDVEAADWLLDRIWERFPPGTVHLGVVDPGVGSERRAVAVRIAGRWLVAPDNGLSSRVVDRLGAEEVRLLDPERIGLDPLSDTFHGRDLFAPAAALLAAGRDPAGLGEALDPDGLVRFERPPPVREEGRLVGRVVHVDRFGNLVTDLPVAWLPAEPEVEIGRGRVRGLSRSYAATEPGGVVALRGSGGTLEVAVRDGSAAARLGVVRGDGVVVRPAASGAAGGEGEGA